MTQQQTDETVESAVAKLRALSYRVEPHGLHWRVQYQDTGEVTVLKTAELLSLAGGLDGAPPAPETPPRPPAYATGGWHNLPPLLSGWQWDREQVGAAYPPVARLRAPDGWVTNGHALSSAAIAEALRHVHATRRDGAATQLAIVEEARAGVVMMSEGEARECVARIKGHLEDTRRALVDLYEREGWKALGYASWRACAAAEFGASAATLYRQLEAGLIERDISQLEKNATPIPTAQLQPLKDLDGDERRAAWEKANELAGGGKRTAAHVQQAVQELKPAPVLCLEDVDLYARAERSISVDILANGGNRIRAPFEHAGKRWVGVGAHGRQIDCVRVVEAGEAYAPGEHPKGYVAGAYTHQRVTGPGGTPLVLSGEWLVVTRPAVTLPASSEALAAPKPNIPELDAAPVPADSSIIADQRADIHRPDPPHPPPAVASEPWSWGPVLAGLNRLRQAVFDKDRDGALAAARDLVAALETPTTADALIDINRRLARVESWISTTEAPTLAALRGNLDNVDRIERDLARFAEREDVTDAASKALTRRIGAAREKLNELMERGSVPTLQEVGVGEERRPQ